MDSNLVVMLDIGSGNVWIMYDRDGADTLLKESDDYGATWGTAKTITAFYGLDLFNIGGDAFCFGYDIVGGTYEVWKWVDPNWVLQDTLAATGSVTKNSLGLVVGTNYYCISYDEVGGNTGGYLFKYANATTTISNEILVADGWYIQQTHQDTLFKATNTIWYVRLRNAGADYRIYKTIDSGANWSIAFTEQHWYFYPSNYQRAGDDFYFFARVGATWYQIDYFKYSSENDSFFKIQRDTAPTDSDVFSTMVPIPLVFYTEDASSAYMKIGKLVDQMSEMLDVKVIYSINNIPRARFKYSTELSTDQIIEFSQYSGSVYIEKSFSGKAGVPRYNAGDGMYHYNIVNQGYDDGGERLSHSTSTQTCSSVFIALLGKNGIDYLWTDTTATPALSTTISYTFDKNLLNEALYLPSVIGNAFHTIEPNGYTYFRKYSNPIDSKLYYGSGGLNYETVGAITSAGDNEWIDTLTLSASCTAAIIAELDNHKNVLEFHDQNAGGSCSAYHDYPTVAADRIIELDITKDSIAANTYLQMLLYEGATNVINILFSENDLKYYAGVFNTIKLDFASANTFFHLKIICDDSANTCDFYIDGILEKADAAYANNSTIGIDKIRIATNTNDFNYKGYIDAPGLVGEVDPNGVAYIEGDNRVNLIKVLDVTNTPPPTRTGIKQFQYNIWDINGGISANGVRFNSRNADSAHIQQYGKRLWDGRRSFTGAQSQAQTSAIASAMIAWQGMQNNPPFFTIEIYDSQRLSPGYRTRYQNSNYTMSESASSYLIVRNRVDLKSTVQTITITQTIIRR